MALSTRVERGRNAERVMLLIHGRGADEGDLAGLLPYLDPEGRFLVVLPRGPLSTPPGYQWYESEGVPRPDPETFLPALDALDELLDETCRAEGMARDTAVVAGFSQGASLALALGLRRSAAAHPAGVLAMSGFLPDVPGLEYDWDGTLPPVLVQHGEYDPLIPVYWGQGVATQLADRGVPVVYGEYPMGHQVAVESMQQAREWLGRVLAGERPEADADAPVVDEGPVRSVSDATWEQEVLRSDIPVIVDFWAPWCGPCRQVAPVVEQIARMREGRYKVMKCNIDDNPRVAQTYNVQSIPMIGMFRDGRMERSSVGAKPRQQLEAELGMLVIP